jgi:hypothetical protein
MRLNTLIRVPRAGDLLRRVRAADLLMRLRPGGGLTRAIVARRGPPLIIAVLAVFVSTVAVATVLSFAAERTYGAAARQRAADEATSSGEYIGWLATGDAFGGYIQLLRDAEDPNVRTGSTPSDQRTAALRRLLELNTNRFSGLAVVDLNGALVAATDTSMLDAALSEAYGAVRANRGNANSDIIVGEGGSHVDYASILEDPVAGKWGVLVARAPVHQLWQTTLTASIDGGRAVIINREGLLAGGAPASEIAQPWRGRPWVGETIRSDIGGVDSICGLAPIARDTQIDHGWNVAACLPVATVLAGAGGGTLGMGVVSVAVAIVVTVIAAVAMQLFPAGAATGASPDDLPDEDDERAVDAPAVIEESSSERPAPPMDVRRLIESYEERSARLALRMRESVQARLLVASSRVEEAIELIEEDAPLADAMLRRAAQEIDDVNSHELRALGQELHPDLVRLGLPSALRALSRDLAEKIEIEVDADAEADSVDGGSGRAIEGGRRVALYRLVLDTVTMVRAAGIESCTVMVRRTVDGTWTEVRAHGDVSGIDTGALAAASFGIEAFGGRVAIEATGDSLEVVAEFGAGSAAEGGQVLAGAESDVAEGREGEAGTPEEPVTAADEEAA